jgi:hypothetical protein
MSFASEYKAALYWQQMGKAAKGTYTWNPLLSVSIPSPALRRPKLQEDTLPFISLRRI